ncbi:MAG: DUF4132 domain-containing protein [Bacteroidota bacterium]
MSGREINEDIDNFDDKERNLYFGLFQLFINANASKLGKRFVKASQALIQEIGKRPYKSTAQRWLSEFLTIKEVPTHHRQEHGEYVHEFTSYDFLNTQTKTFIKGLIWSLNQFHDTKTLSLLADITAYSFTKIPNIGPRAAGVGNAAIYVLGNTKGIDGVGHLSRLKLKIKQSNTRKLIEKYIKVASEKRGISPQMIEDIAVPHFNLVNGTKTYSFENMTLQVTIEGVNKIVLRWIDEQGKERKSVPSFVKKSKKYAKQFQNIKVEAKSIKKVYAAQRDRLDRSFILDRELEIAYFQQYYVEHGLMSQLTQQLIWLFKIKDTYQPYFYQDSTWQTVEGKPLTNFEQVTSVKLWHPIYASIAEIESWRQLFQDLRRQQDIKQVFREVYLLTDAEINTRTYSNRMAAHILKQHQLNALCSVRGWSYKLMGAFDDGMDRSIAKLELPTHQLQVSYWLNEVYDDNAIADSGIWLYVATDQVRFSNIDNRVIPLVDIPKIVLSEAMRDVDLFVGVSSVGNDPQWQDNGGLPQHRDYWESYSFGDLSEIAKTRKSILENLIPRLKIRSQARVEGKFVIVKGQLRTYKIHIGSTNILMEPNDQYLCIVPSRRDSKSVSSIFLPFEGDKGLSVILSKAFLLADDTNIDDVTITRQIERY